MVDELKTIKFFMPPYPLKGNVYLYGRTDCLHEDTEIFTIENNNKNDIIKRKLKDLPNHFIVLSYDFDKFKKQLKNKIVLTDGYKINSGIKDLYEIEFTNGTKILASSEHLLFKDNGEEIKVKNLTVGMKLFKKNCQFLGNNNVSKRKDVKVILSKLLSKEKNPMYGKKQSDVFKKYLSKINSGKNNPMYNKKHSKKTKKKMSEHHIGLIPWNKGIKQWENKMHPKGMLGKKHTQKTKEKIRRSSIGINKGVVTYPKYTMNNFLGHGIRSSWEEKICKLLKQNNIEYLYEPKTFKIILSNKKESHYTPDLFIIKTKTFIEIKGPLFDKQYDRMRSFIKQYPNFRFIIITSKSNFNKLRIFEVMDYDKLLEEKCQINALK